ncbi:MAG: iron-containing alcohol dehydrogenase [Bryobacterales bacterium]|nr:iron-containing alcohol dehydrogenase [Bryobacteraceae bacterium]MDW8129801.1 iron-containing alcohol dehydrogenase [Bryobacterales bacterium]
MQFEFATAARIVFGCGTVREIAPAARSFGRRVLLVTGCPDEIVAPVEEGLRSAGLETLRFEVHGEPTLDLVRQGVARAREADCEALVAVGGGSAIDAGKAIAALLTNGGDPLDYLEVIGQGRPLRVPSLPWIAVPTTAGTGAEVTRNAVLSSPEHKVKASLRSPLMLARLAVVDPDLTLDLPPDVTSSTGLDALTQLIEPYVSIRANPMTDMFCREGMRRAARSLERACRHPKDRDARTDMSLASLLGGLALANAGLGAVHGFAAAIGGAFDAPHGAVCAGLLPHVMRVNIRALRARAPGSPQLERYREVAQILTGRNEAQPEDGAAWAADLVGRLGVLMLRAYGIRREHVAVLVENAARASSMKGNPVALTAEELTEIIEAAL